VRRIKSVSCLIGLAAALFLPANPARAAVVQSNFTCQMTLAYWPGDGLRPSDCLGRASTVIEGITQDGAALLVYGVRAPFAASVLFLDQGCAGDVPLHGLAHGTVSLTGLKVVRPAGTSATATTKFDWNWDGAVGVIRLGPGTVSLSNGDTASWDEGQSVVGLLVFRVVNPIVPPSCTHPSPITAQMSGTELY
jgi:hypothetical protein